MTEALELLNGTRQAAIDVELMLIQRDEMEQSIARTRSIPTRDPEMNVQHSRDVRDQMGEVAAEIVDLEKDIERLRKILEADRARIRSLLRFLKEDEKAIVRIYYLAPERRGNSPRFTSWTDVEESMHMSRAPIMRKRRRLIAKMDEAIKEYKL